MTTLLLGGQPCMLRPMTGGKRRLRLPKLLVVLFGGRVSQKMIQLSVSPILLVGTLNGKLSAECSAILSAIPFVLCLQSTVDGLLGTMAQSRKSLKPSTRSGSLTD